MSSGNRWHSEKSVASFWTNMHWIQTSMRTRFMRSTFMIDWMDTLFLADKMNEIITLQWHVNHWWYTKPPAMCSLNSRSTPQMLLPVVHLVSCCLQSETLGFKYRIQALTVLWNYLDSFSHNLDKLCKSRQSWFVYVPPFEDTCDILGGAYCGYVNHACFLLNGLNQAFNWPPPFRNPSVPCDKLIT